MGQAVRIGYLRVSTDTSEQLNALENQRSRILGSGVDRLIEDVESGLSQDRPGYLELLHLIDTRQVQEVVCTRVDRLGRDAAATDALIAVAAKRGVRIHCLDGGTIDSETPQGFLLSRMATSMAEMESRMLSMRVRAGYSEGRKRARPLRGKVAWGYRVNADRSALEPDPQEFPRAARFLALCKQCDWRMNTALDKWHTAGLGALPLSSCRAVKAWLLNPVLRGGLGYLKQNDNTYKEIVWDTHEALLSHSSFVIMERQLHDNRRRWGHSAQVKPRLLTGLCVCAGCNRKMTYAGSRTIASVVCKSRECAQRYKSTREQTVREAINSELSKRNTQLAQLATKENPETLALKAKIAWLKALDDPDMAAAIEIKRERLLALEQQVGPDPQLLSVFADPAVWSQLSDEELRELYLALVERVMVDRQEVETVVLRL
jgi:DNA invertase Pin-like site-specific DNA recombinase